MIIIIIAIQTIIIRTVIIMRNLEKKSKKVQNIGYNFSIIKLYYRMMVKTANNAHNINMKRIYEYKYQ